VGVNRGFRERMREFRERERERERRLNKNNESLGSKGMKNA